MNARKMFYTEISRAKTLEQIILVGELPKQKEPESDVDFYEMGDEF